MYKTLSILIGLSLFYAMHRSSRDPPIRWDFHTAKIADNIYEVDLHAFAYYPWHIFPTKMSIEEPGMPTAIIFEGSPYLKAVGTIEEKGSLITFESKQLKVPIHYYEEVIFSQYFSFRQNIKQATLKGIVQWQQCYGNFDNVRSIGIKHFSIIITRE